MKTTRIVAVLAIMAFTSFTSCRKSYTCTCTTVIGAVSTDITHSIKDVYPIDAKKTCNNYQDEANASLPGGTACHL